jgi:hypothetical protein
MFHKNRVNFFETLTYITYLVLAKPGPSGKAAQLRTQVPFLGASGNLVLTGSHSISLGIF